MVSSAKKSSEQTEASALVKFDFHGDQLEVIEKDGEHYAVLGRLCEPIGLTNVDRQWQKLQEAPWAVTTIMEATSEGAVSVRSLRCISLRSVAGWLFSINAGKVRPELRDKLALYQRECADVLADHFLGKRRSEAAERSFQERVLERLDAVERRAELAQQTRGVLSDWQVERIKRDVHELALARVALGWNPSVKAAKTWIQNRIVAASNFGGRGASLENMSDERYESVLVCLDHLEQDVHIEWRHRGEGKKQVRDLKRALQRNLFGPQPDEFDQARTAPTKKAPRGEGGFR